LDGLLADPELYKDAQRQKAIVEEQRTLKVTLDGLFEQWAATAD
jgi:hypothetical protein